MLELDQDYLRWFRRHHFLYLFGFLVNFRPIDSYYYETLIIDKNITEYQYNHFVQPISAYASVITSLIIFLVIGFCAYHYFMIIICIGSLVWSVALWQGVNLLDLQVAEGFKGCVLATEIIYYASIYACDDVKKDFRAITSYIRGIPLEAQLLAGIIAQTVVTNGWLTHSELAFLSVPACAHAILLTTHFPVMDPQEEPPANFRSKIIFFKEKIRETFSNAQVLKWSLWIAVTRSGYMQLSIPMQAIWRKSQLENSAASYNGAVSAISVFLALLGVLTSGTLKTNLKYEGMFLCVVSLLQSGLLCAFANITSSITRTVFYTIFEIVHLFAVTTISGIIAETVYRKGSLGIIFGFINLVCCIVNLIFACTVNNNGIYLERSEEFMLYGTYFLGIMFCASLHLFLTTLCR